MANKQLKVRKALAQQLMSLQEAGIQQLPKSTRRKQPATKVATQAAAASNAAAVAPTAISSPNKSAAAPAGRGANSKANGSLKAAKTISETATPAVVRQGAGAKAPPPIVGPAALVRELSVIRDEVAGCTRCPELARTRTQTVFGVGTTQPELCFLGEAPGADEDLQGEPFVGRAGQLLNKIIEACGLKREEVYIFNVIKCRPPGNRTPLPQEAANCRGYLDGQIALLKPKFICCLGACAAQNLLGTDQGIGKLRGRLHDFQGIQVLCTYHPAYLLRNPDAKKLVWEDMKFLMREMGRPVE